MYYYKILILSYLYTLECGQKYINKNHDEEIKNGKQHSNTAHWKKILIFWLTLSEQYLFYLHKTNEKKEKINYRKNKSENGWYFLREYN